MVPKPYKDYTAPDLVKEWRRLVNDNVNMGRDSHMIKEHLRDVTPIQMLLGIYQYVENKTISIPQFLRNQEDWLVEDEGEAAIELAVCISHNTPPAYWIWQDGKDEMMSRNTTYGIFGQTLAARKELLEWSERILG